MICDVHGAVKGLGVFQNVSKKIGLRVAIVTGEIGGTDRDDDIFDLRKSVKILEELQSFLAGKAVEVFGEGLCGDAQRFDREAAR